MKSRGLPDPMLNIWFLIFIPHLCLPLFLHLISSIVLVFLQTYRLRKAAPQLASAVARSAGWFSRPGRFYEWPTVV